MIMDLANQLVQLTGTLINLADQMGLDLAIFQPGDLTNAPAAMLGGIDNFISSLFFGSSDTTTETDEYEVPTSLVPNTISSTPSSESIIEMMTALSQINNLINITLGFNDNNGNIQQQQHNNGQDFSDLNKFIPFPSKEWDHAISNEQEHSTVSLNNNVEQTAEANHQDIERYNKWADYLNPTKQNQSTESELGSNLSIFRDSTPTFHDYQNLDNIMKKRLRKYKRHAEPEPKVEGRHLLQNGSLDCDCMTA